MQQPYKFTFIIGYRHRVDRLNNLRRVLDWINSFSGSEVILVEQDKHSKISHLNLKCKHIFIKSDLPYNRSWSFNVGLKNSNTNIIVCSDSDLIMNPNDFIMGLNALSNYEMVSPYHTVLDLKPEESMLPLEQIVLINRPGRGENDNQKINISGGISIFRKESLLKIGGWNEDFWSWGGEDDFQTMKVKNFLSFTELKAKCYHLFHMRESPDMNHYNRTLKILESASKLTKNELSNSINYSINKIGLKNKCDK